MELDNIEKLLEKYFEATTSVAEEAKLRKYFSQKNVAPHLEKYTAMFNYLSNSKEERFTRHVPLKGTRGYSKWISVAAVAVLVFGIYIINEYQERKQAEYAYNETKKALGMLAENFGRGTEKVAHLKEFETTKQKIYNNN